MCGIFYTHSKTKSKKYELESSVDKVENFKRFQKLKHRGPDVSIYREIGQDTYGFHRLSIIGLNSKGHFAQPFFYKHIVVLCNGEIYNWKRLYQRYILCFKPVDYLPTDCGIIPLLYEQLNGNFTELIRELEGEFAIILHDTKLNKVYASRDYMGIRPLYYTMDDSNICIASEMKALPNPTVNKFHHIRPREIYSFDLSQSVITLQTETYWSFPSLDSTIQGIPSLEWVLEHMYKELKYSIRQRLESDQPVGCLLSGGIDSSLIASIASQYHPNIQCFTIGVPGSPDVEAAKRVAEYLDVPLTIIDFSIDEGIAAIIPVIHHLETYDITTIRASIPQYLLAKWIRTHTDIKVLLSGEGSDELFSGYVYSKLAPNSEELFKDGVRLLEHLYEYDCLRTDRTMAAWGLEVRVPFLHRGLVELILLLDPEIRLYSNDSFLGLNRNIEKALLRCMIQNYQLLPHDIAMRPKEAFSDAVSASGQQSWYKSIQEWIEPFEFKNTNPVGCLFHNTPISQESKYYRKVFDVLFPNQYHILPEFWLPRWTKTKQVDPSATVLECYHSKLE